jgi:hypothetical protein
MTLRIINADERRPEALGVKVVILGKNGIGKAGALIACSLPTHLLLSGGNQDQGVSE